MRRTSLKPQKLMKYRVVVNSSKVNYDTGDACIRHCIKGCFDILRNEKVLQ